MPAIQPALLKRQIESLLEYYDSPNEFVLKLKDLLDFYADRTRRPAGKSSQFPLIRTYHVPTQVTKQIERALQKRVPYQPEQGIQLADMLWQESWLECRMLAFLILGWLPPGPFQKIIHDHLNDWCRRCGMDRVMDVAFARGSINLWKGSPDLFLNHLESWLDSTESSAKKWGLRVVQALVSDPDFNDLPAIFRLLTPFVESVNISPDKDLLFAVRTLAQRTPQETAYFLKRSLTKSENPGIYVLIRQSLEMFAPSTQQDLRAFLHEMREQ